MSDTERNKKLVLEFWTGDPERKPDYLADDIVWHLPASVGQRNFGTTELRGDRARGIFAAAGKVYEPGGTCDVHHVIAEGDLVSVHCTLHRRMRGGAHYSGSYHMLFRVEGERVAEIWEFLDTALVLERMSQPRAG